MQDVTDARKLDGRTVKTRVGPAELAFNGAMAGVLYGAILGVVLAVIAQVAGAGHVAVHLAVAMPVGGAFAAISGAIVGLMAVDKRSLIASVVTAVIAEGAIRLTVMPAAGLWWPLSLGAVLLTLVCGVSFGWAVHKLVMTSIDWARVED